MEIMTRKARVHPVLLLLGVALVLIADANACSGVTVVSRKDWKGRAPRKTVKLGTPVNHVFIGHTVTFECQSRETCSATMRSIQAYHMKEWWDIGYNFVIGGDGSVYEGTGWNSQGIHIPGWNGKSYGIAFIGNYMKKAPNDKMLLAARKLIVCGIQKGHISMDRKLHGARDATCTASPGDVLYGIIQQWPMFQKGPLKGYRCF